MASKIPDALSASPLSYPTTDSSNVAACVTSFGPRTSDSTIFPDNAPFTWPPIAESPPPEINNVGCDLPTPPTPRIMQSQSCRPGSPAEAQRGQAEKHLKAHPSMSTDKTWVRRVANLNAKLFEHSLTLPDPNARPEGKEHPSSPIPTKQADNEARTADGSAKRRFAIDTTFELSSDLLTVIEDLHLASSQSFKSPPGAFEHRTHSASEEGEWEQSAAPPERKEIDDPSVTPSPGHPPDTGSILLILSSYVRILDIYTRFFDLIQTLLSNTKGKDLSRHVQLPHLIFGTLSLQSSPGLQITLIIRLIEEVLESLRNAISQIDLILSTKTWTDGDGLDESTDYCSIFVSVPEATLHAIRLKEPKLTKSMNDLRRKLQH